MYNDIIKDSRINIRLTKFEKDQIIAAAKDKGKTISEFILNQVLYDKKVEDITYITLKSSILSSYILAMAAKKMDDGLLTEALKLTEHKMHELNLPIL